MAYDARFVTTRLPLTSSSRLGLGSLLAAEFASRNCAYTAAVPATA